MWNYNFLRTRLALRDSCFPRCRDGSKCNLFLTREKVLPTRCWQSVHSDVSKDQFRDSETFPVLDGHLPRAYRSTVEANLKNSEACAKRYSEFLLASRQRKEKDIFRHKNNNQKLLVHERLKLILDDEDFLELSPLAGHDLPYGTVQNAGLITGIGKISGVWCMLIANDATVKGGSLYPITVKKQLRAQEIAIKNHLVTVYLVDSGGAFLPLQADSFPDEKHGGRMIYNIALMSSMKIPQVAVVCGSCVAGAAYISSLPEECVIVNKIGSMFLAGPALVKAATKEDISVEELGGAFLHSRVSGGVDYFASTEEEAYHQVKSSIRSLHTGCPPGEPLGYDDPLYSPEELSGLAPQSFESHLNVKLILSRLTDGSRFHEFKAEYGTTLVTGFAHLGGHLIGIVANNGELTSQASLKGSHFVQLCSDRNVPILFLLNTVPLRQPATNLSQAKDIAMRLRAQASMMTTVACAAVPKITLVIGGCFGSESYAMCGRCFDPEFLFLWPNARVALTDGRSSFAHFMEGDEAVYMSEFELKELEKHLTEESTAFYSSARLWDDGIILPQDSRKQYEATPSKTRRLF
ncbi:methylcrotonoyl-CoA carboxylase beta chain, mitochondrial-like isoform X2 [Erinaceus europaeus]|uniref:methylcrotonoyl-CoA carboxylase n=1 Tax=Erinaceus europaeus TaxID=9365 RepID=A0A1S3WFD7_ERIEU|nr:methylcrotonoyl-CoA carboxylase beta chain, mitochondrial-like isoform X2 [Erinaceus europaeus]